MLNKTVKVGTPKTAWEYVIQRLPDLEYVQNTSFNFGDEHETSNERLYDGTNYAESLNKIAQNVRKGLTWKDIGDASAEDRFKKVENIINKTKSTGKYEYKLINQKEPQIGFILLTYKDGAKEVLFNWDFRDIPQDPVVLLSREDEIFNMFAAQFKGLTRIAIEPYDKKATKSTSKK